MKNGGYTFWEFMGVMWSILILFVVVLAIINTTIGSLTTCKSIYCQKAAPHTIVAESRYMLCSEHAIELLKSLTDNKAAR